MKKPKSFEEGMQRLQELLALMQNENTSLDQSVKLYAEAAQLIRYCNETLNTAKLQIEEIDSSLALATEQED
ncbi:MAG: exodeoxyribonuclease VII small subunit [Gemmiger sp.]